MTKQKDLKDFTFDESQIVSYIETLSYKLNDLHIEQPTQGHLKNAILHLKCLKLDFKNYLLCEGKL